MLNKSKKSSKFFNLQPVCLEEKFLPEGWTTNMSKFTNSIVSGALFNHSILSGDIVTYYIVSGAIFTY